MIDLTDAQRDAIGEMVNMGVGLAADSLSQMTDAEVLLTVPRVSLLTRCEAAASIAAEAAGTLSAVTQRFSGGFGGDALLLFPEIHSLELVRMLLRSDVPLVDMTDFEEETLLEVGNILLNACLGTFADTLRIELETELPCLGKGDAHTLIARTSGAEDAVLCLRIQFSLKDHPIKGYLTFVLDVGSVEKLKFHVDTYLTGLGIPT